MDQAYSNAATIREAEFGTLLHLFQSAGFLRAAAGERGTEGLLSSGAVVPSCRWSQQPETDNNRICFKSYKSWTNPTIISDDFNNFILT